MTTALPKLRVKTAHSEYLIDQNEGTLTRTRQHELASDLSTWGIGDAVAVPYREIMSDLTVGERLLVSYESGAYTQSTPIVSIEEVQ